jgi:uncharacterized membrane protein YccC
MYFGYIVYVSGLLYDSHRLYFAYIGTAVFLGALYFSLFAIFSAIVFLKKIYATQGMTMKVMFVDWIKNQDGIRYIFLFLLNGFVIGGGITTGLVGPTSFTFVLY